MEQIPTEWKDKIPKNHSFPLSSKVMTELLIGVPQFSQLKARYKYQDGYWASNYQRKLKAQDELMLFSIAYSNPMPHHSSSNKFFESGYYQPTWVIEVVAIPKEYVHEAKDSLQNTALPKVRDWLTKVGAVDDHTPRKISFFFDLYHKTLRCENKCS
jgi:hypothetical protein